MSRNLNHISKWLICPICGKAFFAPQVGEWAYKKKDYNLANHGLTQIFCSWHCLRHWEKEHAEAQAELRHKRKQEAAKKGHANRKAASGDKPETADPERINTQYNGDDNT